MKERNFKEKVLKFQDGPTWLEDERKTCKMSITSKNQRKTSKPSSIQQRMISLTQPSVRWTCSLKVRISFLDYIPIKFSDISLRMLPLDAFLLEGC